ncbi:MAG: gliding motility-associated C-terminal domain-containing protein [Lewinellaceae bacterium]|nr:gliding motility-associated C-terminal domain-containing protein [Saprospiraceae bacterium]MCB9330386.1 gliding motility-associated C-terminal domain-containing protein [Lewinellaceae bacterium]
MKVLFTFLSFLFLIPLQAIPLPVFSENFDAPPCDIDLGPDVTVCTNAVFTINPHPKSGGTYTWTGGPGLDCYNCPSPTVSGLGVGVYTYIATVAAPNCNASDTLRITVINGLSPQYTIAPDQGICAGDSIEIGGPAMPGTFYNWYSVPPGFGSSLANPKVKPAGMMTYYLSASNGSCPLTVLDSVRITPVTLNLQINPNDTIRLCQGRSRTIQATISPAGHPIAWTPTTGLQIGANGTSVIATPLTSTLYTATAELGGCVRQRGIYVAVDSMPADLDIRPADTTICKGATVTLGSPAYDPVAFPTITFKWNPLTGALSPDGFATLIVQPDVTTPYRRITRNGECLDTALAVVKVVPAAQIMVMPSDTMICQGQKVDFSISPTPGVTGITWSPASGLSCTSCNTPSATPSASTMYTVSGSFQGCTVSATANINVHPNAPLKFPDDVQLCPGDSVLLNEIFDPLASYEWTSTHPGFGTVIKPNPSFHPTQTATYFVKTDNGCVKTDSVRIFVTAASLTVDGDTTICKNFSVPLTAMVSIPGSIQWRNDLTGGIVSTMSATTVTPSVTTDYTAIYSFGDNCQLTKTVRVTVDGEAPQIIFPLDVRLCPGENLTLNSGPVLLNAVYSWTANPLDPSLIPTAAAPTVSPNQNTTYAVTATLDNCTVSQQIEVTRYSGTLSLSPDTTICSKTKATIKATGSGIDGKYQWNSGEKSASIDILPDQTTVYTVTFTYGDNCVLEDSVQVNVVPGFSLSLDCFPDTSQLPIGTEVTLIAIVDPPQNLSNFLFRWEETTIDTKLLPFNTESIDVTPSSNDSSVIYTLTATSSNGCSQVVFKQFKLIFPIDDFPNAFTPDGDGNNDVFKMVDNLKGLSYVDRMEIFNRWGQRIFESTDPDAFWDGTVNGDPAPSDVYIFRIWWRRGDDALQIQSKGELLLLR